MEPHCLLVRGLTPLFHPPPPHTSCFRLYSWWDLLEGSGQDWKWNSYTPTPPTKSGILIACLNGSHHWVLDVCLSLLWTHAVRALCNSPHTHTYAHALEHMFVVFLLIPGSTPANSCPSWGTHMAAQGAEAVNISWLELAAASPICTHACSSSRRLLVYLFNELFIPCPPFPCWPPPPPGPAAMIY